MSRTRLDSALSDIIGTTVLLAVTVVAVGAAGLAFSSMATQTGPAPRMDILANATESSDGFITIRHTGGVAASPDGLDVVVTSSSWEDALRVTLEGPDPLANFTLGATGFVTSGGPPLAAGDRVEILVYLNGTGTLVAQTAFLVAGAGAPGAGPLDGFTVEIDSPPADHAVPAGGVVRFEVGVTHPAGRKAVERVLVDLTPVNGSAAHALYDDGTMGDAKAGDGSYAAYVAIPPVASEGMATLRVQAYDLDGFRTDPAAASAGIMVRILPSDLSQIRALVDGLNGTSGVGGTSGVSGFNGTDGGVTTLPGTQGPPGAAGVPGTNGTGGGGGGGSGDLPDVDAISPTWGAPGTLVRLAGSGLVNVSDVTFAVQGATTAYGAQWAADPSAAPGERLLVLAPSIPDSDYVVTVYSTSGAWSSAPQAFALRAPQPAITSVMPSSAPAYTQVQVSGSNLSHTTSVTLARTGIAPIAVPWTVLHDGLLSFVTHPGIPAGLYDLTVTAGARNATALDAFTSLMPAKPTDLSMTPTSARVEQIVTVTGQGLEGVSRVTLNQTNASRIIDAGWYIADGALQLAIPLAAAPSGNYSLPYHVELTGGFAGVAIVPETLNVLPTPPPIVTCPMDPTRGEPFTQVRIFGQNFVNVRSVTFGDNGVYFTTTSSNQMSAVTHSGLSAGNYTITVSTATGSATSSCTFQALPLKLVPIYNKMLLDDFAVDLGVSNTGSNDQIDNMTVKLRPTAGWRVTGVFVTPVNYAWLTGSSTSHSLAAFCPAKPVPSTGFDGVSGWTLGGSGERLHSYSSFANQFDYYFGVTLRNSTSTQVVTTYVTTNSQSQNFILPAATYMQTIIDAGFPTNDDFGTCSP